MPDLTVPTTRLPTPWPAARDDWGRGGHQDGSGPATWAPGEMLAEAGKLGLDRVLHTGDPADEASRRTVERHGGVLEDVRDTPDGPVRRCWIDCA